MSAEPLSVALGNVYIRNPRRWQAVRRLLHGRPDVAIICEGGRVAPTIRVRRPGYRVRHARAGDRKGRTDVLVMTRRDVPRIGGYTIPLSKGLKGIASNHDRHAVIELLNHPTAGKVAAIGVHPSPGPQALRGDGTHPIARQYAKAIDRLVAEIHTLRTAGYSIVLGGDVQLPQGVGAAPGCDPYAALAAAGLTLVAQEHLDGIWSDLPARQAGTLYRAHSPLTGADHPFLFGRLARRIRTKKEKP